MALPPTARTSVLSNSSMLGTIALFNLAPEELAKMPCISKCWKAAIERHFSTSLVRLLGCSRVRVIVSSSFLEEGLMFQRIRSLIGIRDLWSLQDPGTQQQFQYYQSFMRKTTPVLAIDGSVLAIAGGGDFRGQQMRNLTIYSLESDRQVFTHELQTNSLPQPLVSNGSVLLHDSVTGLSTFSENAAGVWNRTAHRENIQGDLSLCITEGDRAIVVRQDPLRVEVLDKDQTLLCAVYDAEIDTRPATPCFALSGSLLTLPLINNRLRVYALEGQTAKLISTTEPFIETLLSARIQGSTIFTLLANGRAQLLDAKTGRKWNDLLIDWEDLPEEFRRIEMLSYLDENKIALALNTGSLQIFDLSKSPITRYTLKVTGQSRITSMSLQADFMALSRLRNENTGESWRVELWNWRLGQRLRFWDFQYPVENLALKITPTRADLAVGISGGETRLLSSETRKLTTVEQTVETVWEYICSFFEGIYNCLRDCFNWLDNL
ncbi:MAG: hypothetical protein HYX48_05055 [Chlamydiales bacterium]|nr:hypothetical protein [Chlamydiales bacterium]